MRLMRWAEVPVETLSTNVSRQVIWGQQSTLARFAFAKGTHVSAHAHDSEQHTCVMQGVIKIHVAGSPPVVAKAGEMLLIPGGLEHEVWVMEDSVVIDFFASSRVDWRELAHQYLTDDGE
jgi:quercetin dioxygenase-like cupin family protein